MLVNYIKPMFFNLLLNSIFSFMMNRDIKSVKKNPNHTFIFVGFFLMLRCFHKYGLEFQLKPFEAITDRHKSYQNKK